MKDPEKKNDFVLKLSGKAEIPEELKIGFNYNLHAQGTITSLTESDKNDGTHVIYYKFEPVLIELISEKGEAIQARDTRSKSELLRARLWGLWKNSNFNMEFDDFYNELMANLIQAAPEVVEMFMQHKV